MRIPINLATQPFRRDRPVLIASGLVGLLLAGLLGVLVSASLMERARSKDTRRLIAELQAQISAISSEQGRLDAVLRKPENAEVLDRSIFLNALLYRKAVSWTRIFADLEKVLPHNVRLMMIRPEISKENQVRLEMQVGSEATEPIIDMLKRLESSELFGGTYVHTVLPPSQTEPLFRYRVSVNYGQKL